MDYGRYSFYRERRIQNNANNRICFKFTKQDSLKQGSKCFSEFNVVILHRLRVFENRVLRRVFGPKRDVVTGKWRKLHNEELSDLYSLPNILREVKSRRMRWAGHVARMGRGEVCTGF